MAQNPYNLDEILIVRGDHTTFNSFVIYTISNNTIQFGQNLNEQTRRMTCVIIDNQYYNTQPYWYVNYLLH